MKKKVFLILLMFLVSGFLVYFVYEKIGAEEIWESLLSFFPKGILVVLAMMAISHGIGIFRWQIILKNKKNKVSFKNLISSWLASFGISFFIPFALGASETMRAYSLKRKEKNITWEKSFVSVIIDKVFEGTTSFLMILLGIISLVLYSFLLPFKVWIFFLFLFGLIGLIVYFYFRAFRNQSIIKIIEKPLEKILNHRVKNVLEIEKEIFRFFKWKNKRLKKTIWVALLRQVVDFLACFSILFFMGVKLNFFQAVSIIGFIYLAYYVIPVPAALGVLEIVQALVFSQIGFDPHVGVAFVLLLRAFNFIFALLGIGLGFRSILYWFGEKIVAVSKKQQ